ncbi:MAG: hypothetical protein GY822_07570 [Deltaproteobacteria bacterium]|nr:hypothetical protein [Deltaproteobacteria bacterium]
MILENLQHNVTYVLDVATTVLDAAGNQQQAPVSQDFMLSAALTVDVEFLGVEDGAVDFPVDRAAIFLRLPAAVDVDQVKDSSVSLQDAITGEPLRGVRFFMPPVFAFDGRVWVGFAEGAGPLLPDSSYALSVDEIAGVGGDTVSGLPLNLAFSTVPESGNSLSVVDASDANASLSLEDDGLRLNASVRIYDDNATTVIMRNADGSFAQALALEPDGRSIFDGLVEESAFVEGENTLTFSVEDGVHTLSYDLKVFLTTTAGIPQVNTSHPTSAHCDWQKAL